MRIMHGMACARIALTRKCIHWILLVLGTCVLYGIINTYNTYLVDRQSSSLLDMGARAVIITNRSTEKGVSVTVRQHQSSFTRQGVSVTRRQHKGNANATRQDISVTMRQFQSNATRQWRQGWYRRYAPPTNRRYEAYKFFDFPNMTPIKFSPIFKNPCWNGTTTNGPIHDNKIHCVPYFYIIGIMKCGTTDLFQRLLRHPEVVFPGFKEAQWFARKRVSLRYEGTSARPGKTDQHDLSFFVKMYDKATRKILRNRTTDEDGHESYSHVTADASPSNIFANPHWWLVPGNENLTEPRYTNLHCIHALTPGAKIIILFRDPVTRLYSDYLFRFRHGGTPSRYAFHSQVVRSTTEFNKCLYKRSLRECVYSDAGWTNNVQFRLDLGLFAFYLREVLRAFKKENVHTILLPEYQANMRDSLQKVIAFLGLRRLTPSEMEQLLSLRVQNNKAYIRNRTGAMLPQTERLLREFYRPYNQDMATLMADDRFLFSY